MDEAKDWGGRRGTRLRAHGLFLKRPFRGVSTAKERRTRRLHRRRIPAPRAETRVIGLFTDIQPGVPGLKFAFQLCPDCRQQFLVVGHEWTVEITAAEHEYVPGGLKPHPATEVGLQQLPVQDRADEFQTKRRDFKEAGNAEVVVHGVKIYHPIKLVTGRTRQPTCQIRQRCESSSFTRKSKTQSYRHSGAYH